MSESKKLTGFIIFIIAIISMYVIGNYNSKMAKVNSYNWEIIGVIEDIKYDAKKVPTIHIHKVEYYLYEFGVRQSAGIQIGDSIYKEGYNVTLKHYKKYYNGYYLDQVYRMER